MTDLNMPNMDGIELIRNLKASAEYTSIPVMMVTTEADDEEKQKAMHAGAVAYLVKPVTGDVVTENVRNLLKQYFPGRS